MAPTPYFPAGLELPGFVPPLIGLEVILGVFFAVTAVLVALAWLAGRSLCTPERVMAAWMVATGAIHLVVEGAFSVQPAFFRNTDPNMLLLELWKEYSKADSRYATRDSFVVSMETVTAFVWGPACFLVFLGLIYRASWRWTLLLVVSVGQLYGDVLYFATCALEGGVHVRPEPLYFCFYFVFMNGIWIVVPSWCVLYAWRRCNAGVRLVDAAAKAKKRS